MSIKPIPTGTPVPSTPQAGQVKPSNDAPPITGSSGPRTTESDRLHLSHRLNPALSDVAAEALRKLKAERLSELGRIRHRIDSGLAAPISDSLQSTPEVIQKTVDGVLEDLRKL